MSADECLPSRGAPWSHDSLDSSIASGTCRLTGSVAGSGGSRNVGALYARATGLVYRNPTVRTVLSGRPRYGVDATVTAYAAVQDFVEVLSPTTPTFVRFFLGLGGQQIVHDFVPGAHVLLNEGCGGAPQTAALAFSVFTGGQRAVLASTCRGPHAGSTTLQVDIPWSRFTDNRVFFELALTGWSAVASDDPAHPLPSVLVESSYSAGYGAPRVFAGRQDITDQSTITFGVSLTTPEPSSILLVASGLLACAGAASRRARRARGRRAV